MDKNLVICFLVYLPFIGVTGTSIAYPINYKQMPY